MHKFVRDVLSVFRSKGIVLIAELCKGIILARWLGPEKIGTLAALMVFPSLLMSIGSLGLQQSTTYFLGKQLRSEVDIKRVIVQMWCLSTAVCLISCYLLVRYASSTGDSLLLVLLVLLPIPFTLFNRYNGGLFLGRNNIQAYNRINWIPAALNLVSVIFFVTILDAGLPGVLIAALVGPIYMSILLFVRHHFIQCLSIHMDWALIRGMLSLGFVYAFSLMVINLNFRIDIVILDRLSTEYQVGIYSKGVGPVENLWQIPMILSTIIFARSATSKDGKKFSLKVLQLLRVSLVLVGGVSLVLFVYADQVITLLYGKAFLPSSLVLTILLPGVFLLTLFKVLNMDLAGKGKPWVSLIAMGPALIINIILNVLWIPGFGANGAAVASTISYSVAAILFVIVYARVTGISIREIAIYRLEDFTPLFQLFKKPLSTALK